MELIKTSKEFKAHLLALFIHYYPSEAWEKRVEIRRIGLKYDITHLIIDGVNNAKKRTV